MIPLLLFCIMVFHLIHCHRYGSSVVKFLCTIYVVVNMFPTFDLSTFFIIKDLIFFNLLHDLPEIFTILQHSLPN